MVRFGDVVRNVDDVVREPQSYELERYVGLEHIDPESLHIRRWGLIADGTSFTRRFRKGQVLFGKRRAYQRKVAVAEFDGLCSSDILVFEPKNDLLLPELLPFICQTDGFFEHALDTSAGSLSPRTKFKELAHYEFPLPPLDEQRRIAEILWAIDNLLMNLSTTLHKSNKLIESIRTYLLCNPEYPRKKLGNYLRGIIAGKSLLGRNDPIHNGQYGVLKISSVGETEFLHQENKTLVNQDDFIPEFCLKSGNVLITRANTKELVGKVCIVEKDYPNLMLSDKTLLLQIDYEKTIGEYIVEALRTHEARRQIESAATGTGGAMKNITQLEINNFLIPIPSLTKQKNILRKIQSVRNFQASIFNQINKTNLVKLFVMRKFLAQSFS